MKGKVAISGDIRQMAESDLDYLMNINLKGVFRGIKLALPFMIKQQALDRVRVLDFSQLLQGPYATQMMGYLDLDVIKDSVQGLYICLAIHRK